jgi:TIR domain
MLFISHSSKDLQLVQALIDLLRSALSISPEDLRCSSVDGYRLPAGVGTDDQLRLEVHDADAFIVVISYHSLQSLYVVFELGARWGAGKPLVPLLARGVTHRILRPPLSSLNIVSCESAAQLHQLVKQLATTLKLSLYPAENYQRELDRILSLPPAEGEVNVPKYLLAKLELRFPERKERLSPSQRDILDYLETESLRRGSVPQQDFEAKFASLGKSIFWRLEALCYVGFVAKEVTNYRSGTPTYNYSLSDEYHEWRREH